MDRISIKVKDNRLEQSFNYKKNRKKDNSNIDCSVNAIVKVKNGEIENIVFTEEKSKYTKKYTKFKSSTQGTIYVSNLSDSELKEVKGGNIPKEWIQEVKEMLEEKKMSESKNVAVVEGVVESEKVEEVEMVESKNVAVVDEVVESEGVEDTAGTDANEKVDTLAVAGEDTEGEESEFVEDTEDEKADVPVASEEDSNGDENNTEGKKEDIPVSLGEAVEIDMLEINVNEQTTKLPENPGDTKESENPGATKLPVNADKYDVINSLLDITHPVDGKSKTATLCFRDGHILKMQLTTNSASKIDTGCIIYLVDESGNRRTYVGNDGAMRIGKEKIHNATDVKVFNCLNKFNVKFTKDDKITALNRARKYINMSKQRIELDSSMNITDAYRSFIELAITKAKIEEKNVSKKEERREYKYNEEEGTIQIIHNKVQEVLDEADTGFKRRKFCEALKLDENETGEKYIYHNRQGSYGYLDSNDITWYKFSTKLDKKEV